MFVSLWISASIALFPANMISSLETDGVAGQSLTRSTGLSKKSRSSKTDRTCFLSINLSLKEVKSTLLLINIRPVVLSPSTRISHSSTDLKYFLKKVANLSFLESGTIGIPSTTNQFEKAESLERGL
eukprot:NODE_984_length_2554_cov_0.465580.p3 type:complete len:127 gc:universal NODE_984_length_2554_cov_0.465580:641-261(-)